MPLGDIYPDMSAKRIEERLPTAERLQQLTDLVEQNQTDLDALTEGHDIRVAAGYHEVHGGHFVVGGPKGREIEYANRYGVFESIDVLKHLILNSLDLLKSDNSKQTEQ